MSSVCLPSARRQTERTTQSHTVSWVGTRSRRSTSPKRKCLPLFFSSNVFKGSACLLGLWPLLNSPPLAVYACFEIGQLAINWHPLFSKQVFSSSHGSIFVESNRKAQTALAMLGSQALVGWSICTYSTKFSLVASKSIIFGSWRNICRTIYLIV